MNLSFIIPAHNEQCLIGATLDAIHAAAKASGADYEVIVVNDASTDETADAARRHQAAVLDVSHRQIAATRNSGARAARGERLFFVDADTAINASALKSALRWMDKRGVAGGGALTRFDGAVPLYARLLMLWLGGFMKLASVSAGSFMFCTREAFQGTGGFDERLFGGEDAAMSAALKQEGRFVVIGERVVTSGRRVRAISGLPLLWTLTLMALLGPRMLGSRSAVEKIWYDSNRANDQRMPTSFGVRASNAIALAMMVMLMLLPLWWFPWPQALMTGPVKYIRLGGRIFLSHAGLVLWPCAFYLFQNLIQQKRWIERVKLATLIGLSLWLAWGSTQGVIWTWKHVYNWL